MEKVKDLCGISNKSIMRELQEEDWKSDIAQNIAFVLAASTLISLGLVLLFLYFNRVVLSISPTTLITLALIILIILILTLITLIFNSKLFLFPGAYLHYRNRKRIRKQVMKK